MRAVIVGGSRGVGAHLARRLAEGGWEVSAAGRRDDAELPAAVRYVRADLATPDGTVVVAELLATVQPDLIVYNAASYGTVGAAVPAQDELDAIFRVNATVPYRLLLQHFAAQLAERFCSCIVVNSDSIYHVNEAAAAYAASKAALRVLTSALAAACRIRNASVSTLLLGPLADDRKIAELHAVAARRGVSDEEITRTFMRRSNPSFVTDSLIDLDACFRSVEYIVGLGRSANGMQCRLDGGSAGSLI